MFPWCGGRQQLMRNIGHPCLCFLGASDLSLPGLLCEGPGKAAEENVLGLEATNEKQCFPPLLPSLDFLGG